MKSITLTLSCLLASFHLLATDLTVQLSGPVGTYSSIGAAVTAAAEGDVIYIVNRPDNLPWSENITVNKSLTFLSAVDNQKFWVEGKYTIERAENRKITFIGMKNTNTATDNISYNTTVIPVNRTQVTILGSELSGNIYLNVGGINLYLGNSTARGVEYCFGKIIGNDLKYLNCYTDNVPTTDVNLIIGNRIYNNVTSDHAFYHSNNSQYLYFSNNYCRTATTSFGYCSAYFSNFKSGSVTQKIINSSFEYEDYTGSYSGNVAALKIGGASTITLNVENCFMRGSNPPAGNGAVAVNVSGTILPVFSYNVYYSYSTTNNTVLSTALQNTTCNSCDVNTSDGSNVAGFPINSGNPLNDYLDLDLSRNDVGCYGGSYSMANFFPFSSASSVVNYMTSPRTVPLGNTVDVKVTGFDK